jgi:hypothetical protein
VASNERGRPRAQAFSIRYSNRVNWWNIKALSSSDLVASDTMNCFSDDMKMCRDKSLKI